MYSDWSAAAQAFISKIAEDFSPDTSEATVRKALRSHAQEFHGGTSWGRKVWPRECRKYLAARFGQDAAVKQARVEDSPLFNPADIAFPFRQ